MFNEGKLVQLSKDMFNFLAYNKMDIVRNRNFLSESQLDSLFEKVKWQNRKSEDFETEQNSEFGYEYEDYYNEMMRDMEGESDNLYNQQFNKHYEEDMQKYMMDQAQEREEEWMTEPDQDSQDLYY